MSKVIDVIIVGGGASGFFTALQIAEQRKGIDILILEKGPEVLQKVRVSGGGRCNVTNACFEPRKLAQGYPRGEKFLSKAFQEFHGGDMVNWLKDHGVTIKAEPDGRMFPSTDSSETIIKCFTSLAHNYGVKIYTSCGVKNWGISDDIFTLETLTNQTFQARQLVMATGGIPKLDQYHNFTKLGVDIIDPLPSLFTLNIRDRALNDLMGVALPHARLKLAGRKLETEGPLLITHWGLSGPATLRLSAWGARELHALNYNFSLIVDWSGKGEAWVVNEFEEIKKSSNKKLLKNCKPEWLPERLWNYFLTQLEINPEKAVHELNKKELNRLIQIICAQEMQVKGKSTFKEEFVTAGGVSLSDINHSTMESKKIKNLYFTGELIDVDGITGGYNFQSAWTTAFIAAKAIVKNFTHE